MKTPAYYIAVFGKPEPPDKDTADSGRFPLGIRGTDTPGERGDILLLVSPSGPGDGFMSAPGIGVVLTKTKDFIFYRYLPFASPVPKTTLEKTLTDEDRNGFSAIGRDTYWLLGISRESFGNATRGSVIDWP